MMNFVVNLLIGIILIIALNLSIQTMLEHITGEKLSPITAFIIGFGVGLIVYVFWFKAEVLRKLREGQDER